jgi:uncharacterized membrane protein
MNPLLAMHITAGSVAILSGFASIFASKGGTLHRRSGTVFLYSMLGLGTTGAVIATIKSQPENIVGGLLAVYMVGTGVLTLRRQDRKFLWIDAAATVLALGIGYFSLTIGLRVFRSPSGRIDGVPPAPLFAFAAITLLAALGDLRMMLLRGLQGRQRLIRHLWRMSFALFIASGSFFIGQAKVIPKPIRFLPALITLAVLPLVVLIYWLVRVGFTRWYRRIGPTLMQSKPGAVAG